MAKFIEIAVYGMKNDQDGGAGLAKDGEAQYYDVMVTELDMDTGEIEALEEREYLDLMQASELCVQFERQHDLTAEWIYA